MKTIIMAGGSGTRLWPYSRKNYPKQFLEIVGKESFIQSTAKRLAMISGANNVYVIATNRYKFNIENQLAKALPSSSGFSNLIVEPASRNTAPAIAYAVKYFMETEGLNDDDILFFAPSDHIIEPEAELKKAVEESMSYARDSIVTFGVVPNRPETGYGYIELADKDSDISDVKQFVEKPDKETAEKYVKAGNYMWNSGMFMFSIGVILDAFQKFAPELYDAIANKSLDRMRADYKNLEKDSIDYAVMEKADRIVCRKLNLKWSDIGSWNSVYDYLPKDKDKNAIMGRVETINVKDSLIISDKRLTTVIGLDNIAVIETDDAVLICDRRKTQDVKEVVDNMRRNRRREVIEHTTTYRPWGQYTVLEEGSRYRIKRIVVNPGAKLSLQRHRHRSEHWVVVKGMAEVEIGNQILNLHENESAFVPVFEMHRLINPGKIPLEMIEVQNGEYVGEDDIERFEDVYGREDNSNSNDRNSERRGGGGSGSGSGDRGRGRDEDRERGRDMRSSDQRDNRSGDRDPSREIRSSEQGDRGKSRERGRDEK